MTRSHINALGNGTCPVFKMKKPNRDFLRDTVLSWLLWEFEVFHIPGDPSCGETVKTLTKLSSQSLFSHLCVSLSFPSREALVITKYKLWMGKNNCPDQICPKLWRQLLRIILKTLSNTFVQGSQQINNLVNQSLFFFRFLRKLVNSRLAQNSKLWSGQKPRSWCVLIWMWFMA